jgi:iron(III) transport system ATP-binding protein
VAARVSEVLSLVGLAGYEQQFSNQLSGGEQQRVALARAIVIRPQVLLFDEPLSNLDAKLRVQMRTEIRDLQRRLAITTVYVTHDQEEAMAVSDRIAVMNQGSIVQEGSAADLYYRPASAFVAQFIGRVNLLPARVESTANGGGEVAVLGHRLAVAVLPSGARAGDTVRLVLRPEALSLRPARDAGTLPRGTVAGRMFLGEKVEYVVRCGECSLQVVSYNASPGELLEEGAPVAVGFVGPGIPVLAEERP